MKRFRQGAGDQGQRESINIAGVLMLLSRGRDDDEDEEITTMTSSSAVQSSPPRVFECKTCNRQFPSFQALGGHRASHKKPRAAVGDGTGHKKLPRLHECSICGLEFAIGQALGGHMRRHRATPAEVGPAGVLLEKKKNKVWLDLNLPPPPTLLIEDCFN